MFRTALALTLALAGPALATQEYILPTLFDVTGVASDDVLNIRAEPNAKAAIIGTLAPDAFRIEVVEERQGWARVNTGEGRAGSRRAIWPIAPMSGSRGNCRPLSAAWGPSLSGTPRWKAAIWFCAAPTIRRATAVRCRACWTAASSAIRRGWSWRGT
ncbi:SH3 domain-containing protein [Paracoccus aerius]